MKGNRLTVEHIIRMLEVAVIQFYSGKGKNVRAPKGPPCECELEIYTRSPSNFLLLLNPFIVGHVRAVFANEYNALTLCILV